MESTEQAGIFSLHILDEVASTNDEVKRAIDSGEKEGFALGAYVQTAGYGRQGRTWQSPYGGMYVSCLLRPCVSSQILPTLSLVAVLSLHRVLEKFLPDETFRHIKIKWPNDLIYCDNDGLPLKLCGISLEAHAKAVCVGIGLNVFAPEQDDAFNLTDTYAYLNDLADIETSDAHVANSRSLIIKRVCLAVLKSFSDAYRVWLTQGFIPFLDEYESCSYLTGRHICVENIDGSHLASGNVLGVTEEGSLMISSDDSNRQLVVSSGEVHISAVS